MPEYRRSELMPTGFRRWGLAWIALATSLALHVFDEAMNDFLSFYNPMVEELRLPFPTFEFSVWMAGLVVAIITMILLTPFAFRGSRLMVPLSYFLGGLMIVNGLAHIVMSLLRGSFVPGVLSSRVLIAAAVFLLVAVKRREST